MDKQVLNLVSNALESTIPPRERRSKGYGDEDSLFDDGKDFEFFF